MDDDDIEVRLSLLDNLLDDDPDRTTDPVVRAATVLRRFKDSIRRDLAEFLNTRQRCLSWPKQLKELNGSVLDYGIPDVSGSTLSTEDDRKEFLSTISNLIRRHDPRFRTLKITPTANKEATDRTLRFRIQGVIRIAGEVEKTNFDFQLEPVSRVFK